MKTSNPNSDNNSNNLNESQAFAVDNYKGAMLIIAGAGSGKTRVITYRIAKMLNSGIRQKNILALTFTVKAATEMKERVEGIFSRKLRDLDITNFHSFGCELLRKNAHLLGYKNNFSIYDTVDQIYVLKSTLFEMGEDNTAYSLPDMLKVFSDIKTSRIARDKVGEKYRQIYDEYCDYLKACNAVDFDDLIYLPIQLFQKYPDVLSAYRERYQYILVDEFQDTSSDQYEMVYLLAKEHQNICVVGDDDQSIYSFRGADYQNIVNFEKDFPSRKLVKLEQNYRSSKQILDVANAIIKNNKSRKEKTLWSDKSHSNASLYCHKNDFEEIRFLIEDIKIKKLEDRGLKFSDFAILTRTNTIMSKVEEELIQDRIPYYISGGFSFFDKAEIKDMVCYLRFILNPLDDASLIRIINKPRRNIGKVSLQIITSAAKKQKTSVYKVLLSIKNDTDNYGLKQNTIDGVHHFLGILDDYKSKFLSNKNLAPTMSSLITEIDYTNYLTNQYGLKDNIAKFKMQNVRKFIDMLDRYEKNPDNFEQVDIYKYINNIALASYSKEDRSKDKDKVGLLTIHSAKGLEWDTVYIIAIEEGTIPHAKSLTGNESDDGDNSESSSENSSETKFSPIEEERRLFYVALTRAKRNLILNYCQKRRVLNKEETKYPSPFLQELPMEMIDEKQYQKDIPLTAEEMREFRRKRNENENNNPNGNSV